jgi:hypothetical protein
MATQSREPSVEEEQERGLLGQIEVHSIDWIPDTERHGKVWQQAMLWFLGNFQYFTIPIGFVGPALGLSLGWSILAGERETIVFRRDGDRWAAVHEHLSPHPGPAA